MSDIGESIKIASYLQQENSVLHERVRKLENILARKDEAIRQLEAMAAEVRDTLPKVCEEERKREREACAKVAEEYGIARDNHEKKPNTLKETALGTAKHIATLIRGRAL